MPGHRGGAENERRGGGQGAAEAVRGAKGPAYLRSDNGPEFIAKALTKTLAELSVACRHIDPGSPWQNGRNERFNGAPRSECRCGSPLPLASPLSDPS